MSRVLVTGGAGFVGSHVVDRFLSAGDSVVVVDDLSTGKMENLPAGIDCRVAKVQSPAALDMVRTGGFQVVVHLASQIGIRTSISDPVHDADNNVIASVHLLEAVRALPAEARPRFVFSSTGGALYGKVDRYPTDESSATNPESPYGITKLAVEFYLGYYSRIWGLETVALRFGNVYGPRQNPHGENGVVAIFAECLLSGQSPTIFGTGEQTRDYIYVSDVADAIYAAATRPLPPAGPLESRAINIGTGIEISVAELARLLAQTIGVEVAPTFKPARLGEVARSLLSTEKAAAILGWKATVSITEGLTRTVEWVRQNH